MRILIVEDEIAFADALQFILNKSGYQVDVAHDGLDGEAYYSDSHKNCKREINHSYAKVNAMKIGK